jgi:hypothetical protein
LSQVRLSMRFASQLLLGAIMLVSLVVLFIPAYLIRPFVAQSLRGIAISYALRSVSPAITLAALVVGMGLILFLWRSSRSVREKCCLAGALMVLVGGTILSRQNHFEWMFRPIPQPGWVEIGRADRMEDNDMVIGVRIDQEVKAYPVRILGYHHLVNDIVGGEPIVVTY